MVLLIHEGDEAMRCIENENENKKETEEIMKKKHDPFVLWK